MVGLNYMVHQTSGGSSAEHMSHRYGGSDSLVAFAKGYAAAATGSSEVASNISALQEVEKGIANSEMGYRAKQIEIQRLELEAVAASKKGDSEKAIETMKKAIALEETNSPPSGPPELIKPPHELFGEILLTAGRADEAVKMFAVSLSREPNRARSLIGTARALAAKGDAKGASEAYAEFMKIWSKADSGLPELEEARKTVRRAD
jgi:tetratricopeptide (TPR) repeat protein